MPKIKYRFSLTPEEREELEAIFAKGNHNSQKVLNAQILLNYDEDAPKKRTLGKQDIANVLKVSAMKIHRTACSISCHVQLVIWLGCTS